MVNERFARVYFPDEDPLGKQVRLNEIFDLHGAAVGLNRTSVVEIVGVVKDSRQIASRRVQDLSYPASPEIYTPLAAHGSGPGYGAVGKDSSGPARSADPVRRQVLAIPSRTANL